MNHHTIDIDGTTLHYYTSGSGKPIILMHGWGCRASTLDSVARTAELTHTVYSVDFPGFGLSPEPDGVWGVEEYTRLIEKFADLLGLDSPALLGHSFGGRVGLLYSSRRPVSKLILVDAAGIKPRRSLRYYIKVYSFKAMKRLALLIYGREGAARRIEQARAKAGSSDYAQASPRMRAILSRVVNEDLKHVLPTIKAPTLLIWGENDTATPLADARLMARRIPDAGLVSFPGCGHYSFLDNPVQFAAVLGSFLSSK
ncbi:MAG: alpha/beta hydrolase [Muribaculaceae bacterium]|nr:alpha/beta hydrolase [Muribaculaceae bacterium]